MINPGITKQLVTVAASPMSNSMLRSQNAARHRPLYRPVYHPPKPFITRNRCGTNARIASNLACSSRLASHAPVHFGDRGARLAVPDARERSRSTINTPVPVRVPLTIIIIQMAWRVLRLPALVDLIISYTIHIVSDRPLKLASQTSRAAPSRSANRK